MSDNIFISYNHKDEVLIDMIARRLELEFGRNNIFYDKWSMQPGDSIIGKMNEGLEEFTTFFFFVSPNSLESKMVSLEWQTALNKAVNNNLKFIAVRIADCSIPAILSDKLYIDVYGEGIDNAIEKMKCVVKGDSTYKAMEELENIKVSFKVVDNKTIRITIKTLLYAEGNPTFAFACSNSLDEFSACFNISEGMTMSNHGTITTNTGETLNMRTVQLQRPLKPGFPFIFEVYLKETNHLSNVAVYLLINAEKGMYKQLTIENE